MQKWSDKTILKALPNPAGDGYEVNIKNPVSWVVNALVEATPISAPASVIKAKSDSLTSDDPGTLQIVKLAE